MGLMSIVDIVGLVTLCSVLCSELRVGFNSVMQGELSRGGLVLRVGEVVNLTIKKT